VGFCEEKTKRGTDEILFKSGVQTKKVENTIGAVLPFTSRKWKKGTSWHKGIISRGKKNPVQRPAPMKENVQDMNSHAVGETWRRFNIRGKRQTFFPQYPRKPSTLGAHFVKRGVVDLKPGWVKWTQKTSHACVLKRVWN